MFTAVRNEMKSSKTFTKVDGVPNLYQRGGRYYARVSINGKQTWRSLDTDKIRAAKKALAEIQTGRVTHQAARREPTLHAAMEDTIQFRRIRRGVSKPLSPATLVYHGDLLVLAKRILPDRALSSIHVGEILSIIGESGVSQSRRKGVFELVKQAYTRAVEAGQVAKNPLAGHVPGQVPAKERTLPTRDELDSIVEAVVAEFPKNGRGAALSIRLLAFSGMRISEARALDWVDVTRERVHVRGTKTVRSDRWLQINGPLAAVLEEIGGVYGRLGPVMPIRDVRHHLAKGCDEIGTPRLTHHDLRAWFATWAFQSGVDVPTVADWLGDAAAVVLERYTAIMDAHKMAAAEKLS